MKKRWLTCCLFVCFFALGISNDANAQSIFRLPFADQRVVITSGWLYESPLPPPYAKPCVPEGSLCHRGIDYAVPGGSSFRVLSAAGGKAIRSYNDSYGNFVLIAHDVRYRGLTVFTLYAHLSDGTSPIAFKSKPLMQEDIRTGAFLTQWQSVDAGIDLGMSGDTGDADGIHLHFEIQRGDYPNNKTDPYGIYGNKFSYPTPCQIASGAKVPSWDVGVGHFWTSCPPDIGNQPPTAGFAMSASGQPLTLSSPPVTSIPNLTLPSSALCNCAVVGFDGRSPNSSDSDGSVVSWQWTFDGASAQTTSNFSMKVPIGTHRIALVVTDNQGVASTAAKADVTVSPFVAPPPVAVDDGPYPATQGALFSLAAPGVLGNDIYPAGAQVEFLTTLPYLTNVPPFNGGFKLDFGLNPTFVGRLQLQYVVHSSAGDSNIATVTIDVSSSVQPWTLTASNVLSLGFTAQGGAPLADTLVLSLGGNSTGVVEGDQTRLYNDSSLLGAQRTALPTDFTRVFRTATSSWPSGQVADLSAFQRGTTLGTMQFRIDSGSGVLKIDPSAVSVKLGESFTGDIGTFVPATITRLQVVRNSGDGIRVSGSDVFLRSLLPDSHVISGITTGFGLCLTYNVYKGAYPSIVKGGAMVAGSCPRPAVTWGSFMDGLGIAADTGYDLDTLLYNDMAFPREDSDYWFELDDNGNKTVATLKVTIESSR